MSDIGIAKGNNASELLQIARGMSDIDRGVDTTGLLKSLTAMSDTMSKLEDSVSSLGGKLSFFAENMGVSEPFIKGVTGALSAMDGVGTALSSTFSLINVVISAGPWGWLVAAIGLAAGAAGALFAVVGSQKSEIEIMTEKQRDYNQALREQADEYDNLKQKKYDQISADLTYVDSSTDLLDELQKITDANGLIKQGYEDRAQAILTMINDVLGTEYEVVDGQIQKYGELITTKDTLIAQKQLEIILSNEEITYKQALMDQSDLEIEKQAAELDLKAKSNAYTQAQLEMLDAKAKMDEETEEGKKIDLAGKYQAALDKVNELRGAFEESQNTYLLTKEAIGQNTEDIAKYHNLMTVSASGDLAKMQEAIEDYRQDIAMTPDVVNKSEEEKRQIYARSYAIELSKLNEYATNYKNGVAGFTEDGLKEAVSRTTQMKSAFEEVGGQVVNGTIEGLGGQQYMVEDTLKSMMDSLPQWAKEQLQINSPSAIMRDQVGKPIAEGVAVGISTNAALIQTALVKAVNASILVIKSMLGIKSPSRVTEDELGKPLIDGVAVGIRENSGEVSEAFQDALDVLQLQRDLDLINDEEYYQELEKLRDQYLQKGTEEWWKYTKQLMDYDSKVLDNSRKTFSDLAKIASSKLKEVQNLIDTMSNKLKDYGDLIVEREQYDGSTYKQLTDFGTDIATLNRYDELLSGLQARGVSDEFFEQLADMSVDEAIEYAELLMALSQEQFDEYMAQWQKKQDLSESIAKKLYKNKADAVATEIKSGILEAIKDLPPEFYKNGVLCADLFDQGLIETLQGLGHDMLNTLFGQEIADQIRALFASMGVPLDGSAAPAQQAPPETAAMQTYADASQQVYEEAENRAEELHSEIQEDLQELPPQFAEAGRLSADSFQEGFLNRLKGFGQAMIRTVIGEQSMENISAVFGSFGSALPFLNSGKPVEGNVTNIHQEIRFDGAKMPVSEQRRVAREQMQIDRMRWGI